ncbi:MAG: hypothetical protein AAFV62_09025 [Pseudomonadota bacterium]
MQERADVTAAADLDVAVDTKAQDAEAEAADAAATAADLAPVDLAPADEAATSDVAATEGSTPEEAHRSIPDAAPEVAPVRSLSRPIAAFAKRPVAVIDLKTAAAKAAAQRAAEAAAQAGTPVSEPHEPDLAEAEVHQLEVAAPKTCDADVTAMEIMAEATDSVADDEAWTDTDDTDAAFADDDSGLSAWETGEPFDSADAGAPQVRDINDDIDPRRGWTGEHS